MVEVFPFEYFHHYFNILWPTKRKKVRIVDFGDTLTEILKTARKEQLKSRMQYGELYHHNFSKGFENFHQLRHTYTSNLLSNGASPKDVQELLGHSDVSTTMNVYAHSTRKAKRNSAILLDKVAGND